MSPVAAKPTADATVITAAYAMARWSLTCAAIESILAQSTLPRELILPVDHNPELFQRLRDRWERPEVDGATPKIRVVESRYDGHLGASATTAAELATTEFLVFLDDDAAADPEWLERMLAPYADPSVVAVGGAPLPVYSVPRPRWFPHEFDWVFGCAYAGLPLRRGTILHLIGTTMAVRRNDLLAIGGIHSNDHGDMEMSHRLLERWPGSKLIYEPEATVRHFVHPERLRWRYFWRRCFFVNRSKVTALRGMGAAAHLGAERGFARQALFRGVAQGGKDALRGDSAGLLRALAIIAGLGLAAAGYAVGTVQWEVRRVLRRPGPKGGW
jgi:GT2 family glycosyltransferase